MTVLRATFVAIVLALLSVLAVAQSQQPAAPQQLDSSKLLVPHKNADGTTRTTAFTESPVRWLADQQRAYSTSISNALKGVRGENAARAAWTLLLLSFAYGVLHAAGPGHGKTVVSAWLLATESDLHRGIIIALISSMIQAAVAVGLVGGVLLFMAGAAATARQAAGLMESASYAMIAGLGLYLIWTAFRQVISSRAPQQALAAGAPVATNADFSSFQPMANPHVHQTAEEAAACGCGHPHLPTAAEVRGEWSWSKALGMSLAIGIRPCSGAIVMLLLSYTIGLFAVGVASAFAMAFGTFLTVSAIAALSVYARKLALRLAGGNGRSLMTLSLTLRFAGGLVIAAFGAILFAASLYTSTGPS